MPNAQTEHLMILQSLPVSTVLSTRLEAALADDSPFGPSPAAARDLLALGHERDSIQATRLSGCRCLGAGYLVATSETLRSIPCSFCEEGAAAACALNRQSRAKALESARIPLKFAGARLPEQRGDWPAYVQRWFGGDNDSPWLYLTGSNGVLKSYGAAAIAHENIHLDPEHVTLWRGVPEFLDELRGVYGTNANERSVLRPLLEANFLVLDDIGAESVTEWVQSRLFEVINARDENQLVTVFTSNKTFVELRRHLGARIVDRIVENCGREEVLIKGRNWRLEPGASGV